MKNVFLTAAIASLLLVVACNKSNDLARFDHTGFWQGRLAMYNVALMNRTDGSSTLFFRLQGVDTTGPMFWKSFGTAGMRNDRFEARYVTPDGDTMQLFSVSTGQGYMKGIFTFPGTAEAYDFEFVK